MSTAQRIAALKSHKGPWTVLAKRLGTSPDSIYSAVARHGIQGPGSARAPKTELREKIKALVMEGGRSYTQMAELLGVTKGTVAGQIDRMGLTGVLPTSGPQRAAPVLVDIPDDQPLPGSTPAPLEHVTGCRWPVTGGFCNNPSHRKSLCPDHARKSRPASNNHALALVAKLPFRTKNAEIKKIMNGLVHEGVVKYRIVAPGEYSYRISKTPPE